MGHTRV